VADGVWWRCSRKAGCATRILEYDLDRDELVYQNRAGSELLRERFETEAPDLPLAVLGGTDYRQVILVVSGHLSPDRPTFLFMQTISLPRM
jgi:hypothetical protein